VPISTLQLCPSVAILLSLRRLDRRRRPVHQRTEFPDVRPSDAVDVWELALPTTETIGERSAQRVASGSEELTAWRREAQHRGDRGEHETADHGAQ
jgi:hypothetical protein